MRRFALAYLTTALACILMANLVLIMIYGRQFLALGLDAFDQPESFLTRPEFLITNSVLLALFGLIWFLIRQGFGRKV